jgi:hypothetical protein
MNGPPKEKRGLGTALKTAQLQAEYHVLSLLQTPFGFAFWYIEQRKTQLQDRFSNGGSAQ